MDNEVQGREGCMSLGSFVLTINQSTAGTHCVRPWRLGWAR